MPDPEVRLLSLPTVVSLLEGVVGGTGIRTDVPLKDLGIDSIDLLEWLFEIEEELELEVGLIAYADAEVEALGDLTIGELYEKFVEVLSSADARRSR